MNGPADCAPRLDVTNLILRYYTEVNRNFKSSKHQQIFHCYYPVLPLYAYIVHVT